MRTRIFLVFLFLTFLPTTLLAQRDGIVSLDRAWKFHAGDNMAYKEPGFNDSQWPTISVDSVWELQGHPSVDGYAWYRLRFSLPAEILAGAPLKDSLLLYLGKIDDFDQTYLNGFLLGTNGVTARPNVTEGDTNYVHTTPVWQLDRPYTVSAHDPRVLWGKENVLAVRVYDGGGYGGMWSGGQFVRMKRLIDYLAIDRTAEPSFSRKGIAKTITIRNASSRYSINGIARVSVTGKLDGRLLLRSEKRIALDPEASLAFPVRIPPVEQSGKAVYTCILQQPPDTLIASEELPYILTRPTDIRPHINGAMRYGARPGRPFLYSIATSGARPMLFKVDGLPPGLDYDRLSGIISGSTAERGTYAVKVTAKNHYGTATRTLRLVIGDTIALSPPLGWNSWNAWGLSVDQQKVLASARVFREKGLQDHGWAYINIDDGWEIKGDDPRPKREADGTIIVNEKFPDMKALGDSIHAMGLKLGIYSSPGPLTCGGYTASYGYEENDARSYAAWGIDYLKYDWCSYGKIAKDRSRLELEKPYRVMRIALDKVNRDILYSLCQYGMGKVWEWGTEVGGNCWRTTGDIEDTWESMRDIGFNQVENARYAGPGHWNDPDMLVIGWVGWGPTLRPTRLTPDEQYTHISLWSLLAAPMLLGCDLTRLDQFALSLLTNDEILAINQDPLGRQAVPLVKEDSVQVWVKEMEDGSRAVGVFNLGNTTARYRLSFARLGFTGRSFAVRDAWRQKDVRGAKEGMKIPVAGHGVVMLRVRNAK